jgi:hypothetical protein
VSSEVPRRRARAGTRDRGHINGEQWNHTPTPDWRTLPVRIVWPMLQQHNGIRRAPSRNLPAAGSPLPITAADARCGDEPQRRRLLDHGDARRTRCKPWPRAWERRSGRSGATGRGCERADLHSSAPGALRWQDLVRLRTFAPAPGVTLTRDLMCANCRTVPIGYSRSSCGMCSRHKTTVQSRSARERSRSGVSTEAIRGRRRSPNFSVRDF